MNIAIICLAALFVGAQAEIAGDKVTAFAGYTDLSKAPFTLYSGMLDITDGTQAKAIHYIFSTANSTTFPDATKAPLLLWLNGGPGCSSIGGWLTEIGPYLLFNDTNVKDNSKNNWNQFANILYFESPVGVGFSTGTTTYDDNTTTVDSFRALSKFFEGFSEFKVTDFYIAGESYAGIYIPNLAAYILKNPSGINLKGILVGNGVANRTYLETGFPTTQFLYYHYLIPLEAYTGFAQYCKGPQDSQTDPVCVFWTNMISDLTNNINPYGIYNYCYYSASDPATGKKVKPKHAPWYKFGSDAPCVTTYGAYQLLNTDNAKQSLHVGSQQWNECNDDVYKAYKPDTNGSLAAYEYLLTQNINIWVFSGDTDAVVPFTDTLYWINNFKLPIYEDWRAWAVDGQIGGFTQNYKGLRFVSVRGAGHMVPTDKPDAARILFQTFLTNGTLPNPPTYG